MDICRQCSLFRDSNPAVIEKILSRYRISPIKVHKGKSVALSGENYDKLMVIISGSLAAEMRGISGKTVRIETLPAGSAVATAVLFASDAVLPVCLTADEETHILNIPREAVLDLCSADRDFLKHYLGDMGDKVQFLAEKIRLFQFTTIRQKLIGHLLSSRQRHNRNSFRLSFSREALAEIMGVTRPSLSREFSNLVKEELISVSGRELTILDPESLKEELSD